MSAPFEIPASWLWAQFGDIAQVASNLVDPAGYPDSPHIAPNHVESNTGKILPWSTVAADGVTSPKHRFSSGQIVYSKIRPYLAKVVMPSFEGLCSADMYPINAFVDTRYLFNWMLSPSFTAYAAGQQARTVLPKINERALSQLPVPVPPLAEQRRIVATLDEQLSRLGAGDEAIQKARARIDVLRESMVHRLILPYMGASVLLQDVVEERMVNGRSVPTLDGGFPVLRLTALKGGSVNLAERKSGAWSAAEAAPYLVRKGDFLVSRGNGSIRLVARGGLVTHAPDPVAFPDTLIRIRPNSARMHPEFLATVWNSRHVRRQIEGMARTTAGIYKVSQAMLGKVALPLPPLAIQREITAEMDALTIELRRLTAVVAAEQLRARQLRISLLAQAFAGRLVPQDPNDEPASELLARIRAERAAVPPKQRAARGRRTQKDKPAPPTRVIGRDYQQGELPL